MIIVVFVPGFFSQIQALSLVKLLDLSGSHKNSRLLKVIFDVGPFLLYFLLSKS